MDSEHSESQETSSTSVIEDSLNISFENITFTVRSGFLAKGRKTILNNVCGTFNAGELTVVMGQSGAGKSTLMDILAGYTNPTSGQVFVNDRLRNDKTFRRRSCYILQDSMVMDQLTILESLNVAADLKLGNHIGKEQKKKRVHEIIASLGLSEARNTRAGNLSGGQKKRLAVGLELIHDPPVMFLDEPTSGLDSSISKQIMFLLHLLARQGRTVVVTMHQPSAALLHMVDRLYAVVGGRCAYVGAVSQLQPYLQQNNLICPKYHNTVDYLIEKSSENADDLVESCQNGRNMSWTTNVPPLETDNDIMDIFYQNASEGVTLTMLPAPKENPTSKILLALKSTYSTSNWKQFTTLTRRAVLTSWRDPSFTLMITGIHCAMGLFVGSLFFNIGVFAQNIRDNYNFLYFCLMFIMFTAFSAVSISFPEQIPIIRREHFNRWYTTGAYFASSIVSVLPTLTISTLSFAVIVYWMTGQPCEVERFSSFCFVLLLVSYVGACKGLLIGFSFDVKNGVIFGPFFIMPFTVFSGFFLRYGDAPFYIQWFFNLSFLKHGLVGMVLTIYGMGREKLKCTELFCYYKYPNHFIQETGFADEKYPRFIYSTVAIGCAVLTLTFIILKIRLKHRIKW